jgi:hypothetical protein
MIHQNTKELNRGINPIGAYRAARGGLESGVSEGGSIGWLLIGAYWVDPLRYFGKDGLWFFNGKEKAISAAQLIGPPWGCEGRKTPRGGV